MRGIFRTALAGDRASRLTAAHVFGVRSTTNPAESHPAVRHHFLSDAFCERSSFFDPTCTHQSVLSLQFDFISAVTYSGSLDVTFIVRSG